jgi:hypothetical protein
METVEGHNLGFEALARVRIVVPNKEVDEADLDRYLKCAINRGSRSLRSTHSV